jgi:hypothetical protein
MLLCDVDLALVHEVDQQLEVVGFHVPEQHHRMVSLGRCRHSVEQLNLEAGLGLRGVYMKLDFCVVDDKNFVSDDKNLVSDDKN